MMQLISLLQENLSVAIIFFGLLGLCIGSFLNVVIYRTPIIMMQSWRHECSQLLSEQSDIAVDHSIPIQQIVAKDLPLTLSRPRSHCPQCHHQIRWFENLPVISWLLLKGRCSECHHAISIRYPLVELITALLTILVVYKFGVTVQGGAAMVLVWALIALTGIDADSHLLPDRFTFPLAGLGLAVNTQNWFVSPTEAIWGLLLGFLSLWTVVKIFYVITKKQGMGQGDFKLLAVLGAWLGPMMLPLIILLSSLIGSIIGLVLLKKHGESRYFAFGPFIAIAGIVALFCGSEVMQWYLNMY